MPGINALINQGINTLYTTFIPTGVYKNIGYSSYVVDQAKQFCNEMRLTYTVYWQLQEYKSKDATKEPFFDWINQLNQRPIAAFQSPLAPWMNQLKSKQFIHAIHTLKSGQPQTVLKEIQLVDLIYKTAAVIAYYMTCHMTVVESLKTILSQSEIISKVALPILDRTTSLPIPSFSNSVIIISPFVIHGIYVMLSHINLKTKEKHQKAEWIVKSLNALNIGIDALFHLRYAVICLGMSQTLYISIIRTIIAFIILPRLNPLVSLAYIPTYFIPQLKTDSWSTWSFQTGLGALYNTLFVATKTYDIHQLENLFNQVYAIKPDWNPNDFQTIIDTENEIKKAASKGAITPYQQQALLQMLHVKCYDKLINFILKASKEEIEQEFQLDEKISPFKQIYGPKSWLKTLETFTPELLVERLIEPFDWNKLKSAIKTVNQFQLNFSDTNIPFISEKEPIPNQYLLLLDQVFYYKFKIFYEGHATEFNTPDFWNSPRSQWFDQIFQQYNSVMGRSRPFIELQFDYRFRKAKHLHDTLIQLEDAAFWSNPTNKDHITKTFGAINVAQAVLSKFGDPENIPPALKEKQKMFDLFLKKLAERNAGLFNI